jgi:hypothetical protein
VFGGYTSKSWSRQHNTYTEDEKAWLFSIDNQSKHNIKQEKKAKALMHYDGYLCIFSDGNNDFYVNEGSNNISTKG